MSRQKLNELNFLKQDNNQMELTDEFYSQLVNFYEELDDEQIQKINARFILLLLNEIKSEKKIEEIFNIISDYRNRLMS